MDGSAWPLLLGPRVPSGMLASAAAASRIADAGPLIAAPMDGDHHDDVGRHPRRLWSRLNRIA